MAKHYDYVSYSMINEKKFSGLKSKLKKNAHRKNYVQNLKHDKMCLKNYWQTYLLFKYK